MLLQSLRHIWFKKMRAGQQPSLTISVCPAIVKTSAQEYKTDNIS
jgi:hypothetical protein